MVAASALTKWIVRRFVEAMRRRSDRAEGARGTGRDAVASVRRRHVVIHPASGHVGHVVDGRISVAAEIHANHAVTGQRVDGLSDLRQTLFRVSGVAQRRAQVIHQLAEHGRIGLREADADVEVDAHVVHVRRGSAVAVVNRRIAARSVAVASDADATADASVGSASAIVSVRRSGRIEIGHRSRDFGVADVEAGAALWIFSDLRQDHAASLAVAVVLADDSDTPLLQRLVFGLLRYLDVGSTLFLNLFDEAASFADDHP